VTTLLVAAAAAALGFLVGWILASRRGDVVPPQAAPFGDDQLASDTATHLAASLPAESSFDALAFALLERCAERVRIPCALAMRERAGAPAFIAAVSSTLDPRLLGRDVPLDSPAGRAIADGLPVVGDPNEKVVALQARDRRRALRGAVAVPVSQGRSVVGAVIAFGHAPGGAQDAIDALAELVRRYGPVLVPAHAVAVALRRAETDELTGLANRRALNARLHGNGTAREPAALILLDIDHFKQINDTLGHPAGDAALRQVARLLRETVRSEDLAARVGGEEFAIWLPGTDLRTAQEVAERLRVRVAESPFQAGPEERRLTISCGVAACPVPIGSVANLWNAADVALYRAKRGGRNRVVTAAEGVGG
jgi:diguanylate cyclase (GGDEF)-like protein